MKRLALARRSDRFPLKYTSARLRRGHNSQQSHKPAHRQTAVANSVLPSSAASTRTPATFSEVAEWDAWRPRARVSQQEGGYLQQTLLYRLFDSVSPILKRRLTGEVDTFCVLCVNFHNALKLFEMRERVYL